MGPGGKWVIGHSATEETLW